MKFMIPIAMIIGIVILMSIVPAMIHGKSMRT